MSERIEILKVLVGSRANGLSREDSDYDYRAVYVTPTSELLSLGTGKYKASAWVEGKNEDNTSYELGHFLHLATKSNANILEMFVAPLKGSNEIGDELRDLFDSVWSTEGVRNAFVGYSLNQRKKFLDDKDGRAWKYAVAYIRTLLQGIELIETGTMSIVVPDEWLEDLQNVRDGKYTRGAVVDLAEALREELDEAYERAEAFERLQEPDVEKVNEFLLKVRKENW
ncbi:hypothetical protein LCGC14_0264300 [marine sediment metagenome]|uniref:Nucleotidyltransferase n=1 Tax=marine sediment metagenome TaxID=412755 RepID=A0A0F9X5P2_9ZZZZ